MRRNTIRFVTTLALLPLVVLAVSICAAPAVAQCNQLVSGLREPLGTALSNQGNLLVSETGTGAPGSGRISIVDASGNRRTLLDGLPSGINDVAEPSGPAGVLMRGRTLYVAIGLGDLPSPGPFPGTAIPNPAGPSSPIFSSILELQFSASTEKITDGFTLTPADEQALADGEILSLSDAGGDKIKIRMVADLPNYVPAPLPNFPGNVQLSNPFQLAAVGEALFVTDGGRNLVWKIDLSTGSFEPVVTFPPVPNPLFGTGLPGGPFLDAVPTGIAASGDQLLVTLLRGVPFPPGASTVEQVDPSTGTATTLIGGRTTAIGVLRLPTDDGAGYLVLQHASAGPFFGGPGLVLHFATPTASADVEAACLTRPTSMALDGKTGTLYVSEYGGSIVSIPMMP